MLRGWAVGCTVGASVGEGEGARVGVSVGGSGVPVGVTGGGSDVWVAVTGIKVSPATVPPPIATLSRQLLHNPVTLDVERPSAPAAGVRQTIYPVRQDLKATLLAELLELEEIENALVFTRTKHRANRLANFLERRGIACDRIHGNRSQAQRTRALAGFKTGRTRVLVATDVAARGIHVDDVGSVIHFETSSVGATENAMMAAVRRQGNRAARIRAAVEARPTR